LRRLRWAFLTSAKTRGWIDQQERTFTATHTNSLPPPSPRRTPWQRGRHGLEAELAGESIRVHITYAGGRKFPEGKDLVSGHPFSVVLADVKEPLKTVAEASQAPGNHPGQG